MGDTSVHAFTDLGMNVQLYLFLNAFFWLPAFVKANNLKSRLFVVGLFAVFNILGYYYGFFTLVSTIGAFVLLVVMINREVILPPLFGRKILTAANFWMFIGSLVFFFCLHQ